MLLVQGAYTADIPADNPSKDDFALHPDGGCGHDWMVIGKGEVSQTNCEEWTNSALWFDPTYVQFWGAEAVWQYEQCFLTRPDLRLDHTASQRQRGWNVLTFQQEVEASSQRRKAAERV